MSSGGGETTELLRMLGVGGGRGASAGQYPGGGAETMGLVGQAAALGWALLLLLTFSSVPAGKGR